MPLPPDHRLSIAPMLNWSDRHYRYFMRLITKRTPLYTEMITCDAIINGDPDYHLGFNESEYPLVAQIGGSSPEQLAECARIIEQYGYNEINLNVGCPSDRVQKGRFGACLMAEADLVAEMVETMSRSVEIPITVKVRTGIDEQDDYPFLHNFVTTVAQAGCQHFIIHARKAWLDGLSPKENREIPPLDYSRVYQLKADAPHLQISINGGISTLKEVAHHLEHVDGVMIGREAYHNPYFFSQVDQRFYQERSTTPSRFEVLEQFYPYVEQVLKSGGRLNHLTRHIFGLFQGVPGARAWRRHLSENVHKESAGIGVIQHAASLVKCNQ